MAKMPVDDIDWAYGLKRPPRPDELMRFHNLISGRTRTPPVYIVLEPPSAIRSIKTDKDGKEITEAVVRGKNPISSETGGWVEVGIDEAIEYMAKGHNIGIIATEGSGLVLADIDIPELVEGVKEDTLTIASRKRIGRHYYYIDMDPEGANLRAATNCDVDTEDKVEIISIRAKNKYCVAPGSFVPFSREEYAAVPEHDKTNAGYYTIANEKPPADITFAELPGIVRAEIEKGYARRNQKTVPRAFDRTYEGKGKKSAIFEITPEDLFGNPGCNFSHPVHGSTTGMNCTIKDGWLTCWRHGTRGDGYACLAMLTGVISCEDMYAHGSKTTALKRDGEEYFKVWSEAKKRGLIPFDDKPPSEARKYYAVAKGILTQAEIDAANGGKLPKYPEIMQALENDGLMPTYTGKRKKQAKRTSNTTSTDNGECPTDDIKKMSVADLFGEEFADIVIEKPYRIGKVGVLSVEEKRDKNDEPYESKTIVSSTPFIVTGIGKNIDRDDEMFLRITYISRSGRVRHMLIGQREALCRSTVTKLIDSGILFTDSRAGPVTDYLEHCIYKNPNLPKMTKVETNGWKMIRGVVDTFVMGKKAYHTEGETDVIPTHELQYDGVGPHGNIEEWAAGMDEALHISDLLRFKIYTALAAPLLRPLRVQSFMQDHYGESGSGKSCSSDLALSVYGNPDKLRFNGDTTKTAAEHVAAMFCDLPLYMDETGTQGKKEILTALVYMIANEQGRMRGKKDGGLREIQSWKTIGMTTGEKSIVDDTGFTGQQVRVMQLTNKLTPDGSLSPAITKALDTIKRSYGHIGPMFIQEFLRNQDKYIQLFKDTEKRYAKDGNVTVTENRMLRPFALIYVAGTIAEGIFGTLGMRTVDPDTVVMEYMREISSKKNVEAYTIKALKVILDFWQQHSRNFIDTEERAAILEAKREAAKKEYGDNYDKSKVSIPPFSYEIYGIARREAPNHVDFIQETLRTNLEKAGYDTMRVLDELCDKDILVTNKRMDGRRSFTMSIKQTTDIKVNRVYRIDIRRAETEIQKASGELFVDTRHI